VSSPPPSQARRLSRAALWVLCGAAAYVGTWALLAPRGFYSAFPGPGRHWIDADGPYNEHLIRDVGGLYLALLVLTATAARRMEPSLVRIAGLAWLVFGIPHLAYHALHLHQLGTADIALNVLSLGGIVVLAASVCVVNRPRTQTTHDRP